MVSLTPVTLNPIFLHRSTEISIQEENTINVYFELVFNNGGLFLEVLFLSGVISLCKIFISKQLIRYHRIRQAHRSTKATVKSAVPNKLISMQDITAF